MTDPLPTDVRVNDNSPLAPSATDPSCHDVPTGTPPPVTEGVSGVDANLSPSTMTLRDPSAMSPSIQPTPGTVAWATDGTGHANTSGDAAVVPGYDPSVTATTTSTYVDGAMTSCVTPTTVDATSSVGSPIHPTSDSGIVAIIGCSATSKGGPSMPTSAHPTEGIGATVGGA